MKNGLLKGFSAVIVNCVMGATFALLLGVTPWFGALALNAVALLAGGFMPGGSLCEGVLTEIWTGEMVKALRGKLAGTWLDGISDASSIVNNDVIHMVDVGVDPDVLVNNKTYPIDLQELGDGDIAISLNKFQTKVTPITDDELYASSYDKISRVKEAHANAINDKKFAMAAHALCATKNSKSTPVLTVSGEADTDGRKRMTLADVVAMKRAMDKLGVPAEGRRLILCPDHVNDLLLAEQSFREQYNINRQDGTVGRLYGFNIYEYGQNPVYTAAGVKKDVGSTADDGEYQCSFAIYEPRVFKATGSTKMYYSEASTDPEYQRNKINFRHYFICLPKKEDAGVVMLSTK